MHLSARPIREHYLPTDFIQPVQDELARTRAELSAGLLARPAFTSPKYLYNSLGSKLFEAICDVPEYYVTRTEAAIFEEHMDEIAAGIGRGSTFIDLGAGNCAKASKLFPVLQPAQYVPIDISVDFLRASVAELARRYPQIQMMPLGMDFSSSLDLPAGVRQDRRLFFYPGSSIGNFAPDEAAAFLGSVRDACGRQGSLLIGIDLVKQSSVLNAAYDDSLGVTAAFNLNLLFHLNALLGANFDPADWRHRAFFNESQSRVEMHLEARRNVDAAWWGGRRRFYEGERIHTESSYKYTEETFLALLARAGFDCMRIWTDPKQWFMVCHAHPYS